jgi:hypothetical protein
MRHNVLGDDERQHLHRRRQGQAGRDDRRPRHEQLLGDRHGGRSGSQRPHDRHGIGELTARPTGRLRQPDPGQPGLGQRGPQSVVPPPLAGQHERGEGRQDVPDGLDHQVLI